MTHMPLADLLAAMQAQVDRGAMFVPAMQTANVQALLDHIASLERKLADVVNSLTDTEAERRRLIGLNLDKDTRVKDLQRELADAKAEIVVAARWEKDLIEDWRKMHRAAVLRTEKAEERLALSDAVVEAVLDPLGFEDWVHIKKLAQQAKERK